MNQEFLNWPPVDPEIPPAAPAEAIPPVPEPPVPAETVAPPPAVDTPQAAPAATAIAPGQATAVPPPTAFQKSEFARAMEALRMDTPDTSVAATPPSSPPPPPPPPPPSAPKSHLDMAAELLKSGKVDEAMRLINLAPPNIEKMTPKQVIAADLMQQYPALTEKQAAAWVEKQYPDSDDEADTARLVMESARARQRIVETFGNTGSQSQTAPEQTNFVSNWMNVVSDSEKSLSTVKVGDFAFNYPAEVVQEALRQTLNIFSGTRPAKESMGDFIETYHATAAVLSRDLMIKSALASGRSQATQEQVMKVVGAAPAQVVNEPPIRPQSVPMRFTI